MEEKQKHAGVQDCKDRIKSSVYLRPFSLREAESEWEKVEKLIDNILTTQRNQLRTKLRQAIKQCHGGGNGRRLLEEVLNDI